MRRAFDRHAQSRAACTDIGIRLCEVAKHGAHFTLMVVGESGLGKSTLMYVSSLDPLV